jgi:hypothetical protein
VAERINVHRSGDINPKFLAEVEFTIERLPDEALAAGHVAIWLQIPAAHDVPAPGGYQTTNALEESRFELLHPLVNQGFVVAEDEIWKFLTEVGRGAEGGECFCCSGLPVPLPGGIEMGVTNEMKSHNFFLSSYI